MKNTLKIKGFVPFLAVLVFNAMVDIGHKITIQNILIKSYSGDELIVLSALINSLILIPFVLLFSPSGYISDRFQKSIIVKYSALFGLFLSTLAVVSYFLGLFWFAFFLTFVLALQSAIYSPAKYGLIRELVGSKNLSSANGIVQALTISAILGSGLIFSLLFEMLFKSASTPDEILVQVAPLGFLLLLFSTLETLLAWQIPSNYTPKSKKKFYLSKYLKLIYLKENFQTLKKDRNILLSIIGLSIFWGVSQIIVAIFPAHYKAILLDDNTIIIQAILMLSAVGLIIGSLIYGRSRTHHIELGGVMVGGFGMATALYFFSISSSVTSFAIFSFLFGFFGALATVPLNATIQFLAKKEELGVVLAGNNFIQNIVMILSLLLAITLVQIGVGTVGIFWSATAIILAGTIYATSLMPQLNARVLLLPILKLRYHFVVEGLDNLPARGGVLLLGNHISWIDWLVLQSASPRAIKFIMDKAIYEQWYLKWFLRHFDVIPISNFGAKKAIKEAQNRLKSGEVVAIFPEGHISYNGQLGEFRKGFEFIAKDLEEVKIVPFYLHGLWGSTFSRANKRYRLISKMGARREIGVFFGEALPNSTKAFEVKQAVKRLSIRAWDRSISQMRPIQFHYLRRAKEHPFALAVADDRGVKLSRVKMLLAVILFIKSLKPRLKSEQNIGILLPTSSAGAIINMAILSLGRVVVNLNYTLSRETLHHAVKKGEIKTILTSEKFISKLKTRGFNPLEQIDVRVIFIEDLAKKFEKRDKVVAFLEALLLPRFLLEWRYFVKVSINERATILFSSGSESKPKGVSLTHKNILGNIKQVSAMLNFQDDDAILSSLPIFHSFGLTVTTLLPLCEGVESICVLDPTDALGVGKMATKYRASIMFGTSTFYRIYAKNRRLHPLMLQSIKMAISGAEKLDLRVKEEFFKKFGKRIYEGYGATETSPVVSVNMPDMIEADTLRVIQGEKIGSVGQAIPGTLIKIVEPETLKEVDVGVDGLILVGGVQVMEGYIGNLAKTNETIVEINGVRFYKTGDKGHIDENGFLTITDRFSRFAKIGGEMISLGAVEKLVAEVVDVDLEMIATAIKDEKKGERVVLLYSGEISEDELKSKLSQSQITPIMRPSRIIKLESTPKLATGKSDFGRAKEIAKKRA